MLLRLMGVGGVFVGDHCSTVMQTRGDRETGERRGWYFGREKLTFRIKATTWEWKGGSEMRFDRRCDGVLNSSSSHCVAPGDTLPIGLISLSREAFH